MPSDPPQSLSRIGAVIIGRNEGDRLIACINSVHAVIDRIVYVDSGSSDNSVPHAQAAGATTVLLKSGPFSAARGRQEGLNLLTRAAPETEYVLFIDGDCLLQPGFIQAAHAYLSINPRTAAVTGRRREEKTGFYSRLIDIEWDVKPGNIGYVGGDSLWRVGAIRQVGGWAPELIAGEEPDLCFRLRDKGWSFYRIANEMTLHDIRMTSFRQYWRRSTRAGHAYMEVGWRNRKGAGRSALRSVLSILLYGLLLPLAFIASAIWFWPLLIAIALLYIRVVVSMYLRSVRRGRPKGMSFIYALLTTLCKAAGVVGVAKYLFGRLTGSRTRIIEYRTDVPASGQSNSHGNTPIPDPMGGPRP